MGRASNQDAICGFVRRIISARSGEVIEVVERPDVVNRGEQAVEEIWAGPTRAYAVEHTLLESFEGQIRDDEKVAGLLWPLRAVLAGYVPGTYVLKVRVGAVKLPRSKFASAQEEIVRLTLEAAPNMKPRDALILRSPRLSFEVGLYCRSRGDSSQVFVHSVLEGDLDEMRFERVQRSFAEKIPKLLAACAGTERSSVLVLESDDFRLANVFENYAAVKRALDGTKDRPDTIVLVETDARPWSAWLFKENQHVGDAIQRATRQPSHYEDGRFS